MAALSHAPVLLEAVIENLLQSQAGTYIDGTFGRGGHSRALLKALNDEGRVIGIDRDPEAYAQAQLLAAEDPRFRAHHGTFADIRSAIGDDEVVDGVLLDVGVSSPQLDDPARGFSFLHDGPLDMRMDPTTGISAAEWLDQAEEAEIALVIKRFGEDKFASRIARALVKARPLNSTHALAEVIASALPAAVVHRGTKHPATRTFQALRIVVNGELKQLEQGLEAAFGALKPGGRLAVISFHSLEDRMVKRQFKAWSEAEKLPRRLPVMESQTMPGRVIGKPRKADADELAANPRSRSAILRVIEKNVGVA